MISMQTLRAFKSLRFLSRYENSLVRTLATSPNEQKTSKKKDDKKAEKSENDDFLTYFETVRSIAKLVYLFFLFISSFDILYLYLITQRKP